MTLEQTKILRAIAIYYLRKNNNLENAIKELEDIGIQSIEVKHVVELKVLRPGVIIGKRGENVEKLVKLLSEQFGYDLKIIEVENEINKIISNVIYGEVDAEDN